MPGQMKGGYEKPFEETGKPYLNVVEGSFRQRVEEGTPKAELRKWDINGNQGEAWELIYSNWTGIIQGLQFQSSQYGDVCYLELPDVIIVMKASSKYFTSFARKLKSGDIKKQFTFYPYDFEADDGKQLTGMSLQQDGVKLRDYYYDGEKSINGIPEVDEAARDKKGYWKMYFGEVEEFLIAELEDIELAPKRVVVEGAKEEPKEESLTELFEGKKPVETDLPWEDPK